MKGNMKNEKKRKLSKVEKFIKPDSKAKHPYVAKSDAEGRIRQMQNELDIAQAQFSNGLSEAILGFQPAGIGVQLSQTDTLFKNNRWYLISNLRQLLSQIYAEHGLIQTVVDVPVDDAFRGGVTVKTKQLNEEEVQDLHAEMDRQADLTTMGQGMKWNRLFGGAGVIIMTDQDAATPLDINAITEDSPLEFRAVDMWELFWDKQNEESYDVTLQEQKFEHYSYYGKKLHKSRVMKLVGIEPPSFIRPRLRGWGLSICEPFVRSINQYLKANDVTFEVIDEFKLDIFKIKNLTNTLLTEAGTGQIQRRIALANQQKNYQNALTMDSEDDYVQKQLSFAGIAETFEGIRMQIASDLRMPLTKIFGTSAAGFSAGNEDIENYNAMVEAQIRQKAKYDILKMIEIRCQKMFGKIPTDLEIEFKPLRMLSAEQEENVKTQKFNRLLAALEKGAIDDLQFRQACNRDNLLTIQLDLNAPTISKDELKSPDDEDDSEDAGTDKDQKEKPKDIK